MGTRFQRFARFAAAGISAMMLFAVSACGAQTASEQPASNTTDGSQQEAKGPITVVSSLNQWGSLAAELGGDNVKVTSIMNSTNVDAHDFEPKTSDIAKLSKAQIVVANGAGYDSWATKSLSKTSNLVSAASVVGAMEGDNPHLWFSKDARSGMAEAITEAYVKALPSKKKYFQQRLKLWQQGEKSLEQWTGAFTKSHPKLTYAATEPVAYYLMADLGFTDVTPKGYTQSVESGGESAPADLQSFQKLLEKHDADVLLNNIQEASDATNMITGTAGRSDVPVVDVSEQMPEDADSLNAWINKLINTIIDAVDPTYGCDSDDESESTDGTDSGSAQDNADENADSSDANTDVSQSTDGENADGASNSDTSNQQDGSASSNKTNKNKAENFVRECKASQTGTADSNTSTDSSSSSGTSDSGQETDTKQPDPGK